MKVTILGSGGWDGIPAPFCTCGICKDALNNPKSKNYRTRPEVLIETAEGKFLLEISPDIRLQTSRAGLNEVKDFFVSHWHFDHLYGILELHAWAELYMNGGFTIHCSQETATWIENNFAHIPKKLNILKPFESVKVCGVRVTALPMYHMKHQDNDLKEEDLNNTFGYLLEHDGRKIAYLADYYKIPNKVRKLIEQSEVVIADGTSMFEEEYPDKKFQNAIKSYDDQDHLHGDTIYSEIKNIKTDKVIFHSISHLPEKGHKELQEKLPKGMLLSYDGMVL